MKEKFVKVKTADLVGSALDWAVAQVEGKEYIAKHITKTSLNVAGQVFAVEHMANYRPSTDWAQGGPLLEEHSYALPYRASSRHHIGKFESCTPGGFPHNGSTPLIAACRAIVAAKFGEVVQVPVELVGVGV